MTECCDSLFASDFDIVAFCETWLSEDICSSEFIPDNYTVLRCDRDFAVAGRSRGGGVLIAVKTDFICERLVLANDYKLTFPTLDLLACKVQMGSIVIIFVVLYIPNTPSCNELLVVLGLLEEICLGHEHVFVCGDFNIPTYVRMSPSDPLFNSLSNFLDFAGIRQCNFVKNSDDRLLDLVMTALPCSVSHDTSSLVREDPRHPSLTISLDFGVVRQSNFPVSHERHRYNFRKANYPALYGALLEFNWDFILNVTNVDEACSLFYENLYTTLDRFVPKYKRFTKKRQFPCWFSRQLVDMIKKKGKIS